MEPWRLLHEEGLALGPCSSAGARDSPDLGGLPRFTGSQVGFSGGAVGSEQLCLCWRSHSGAGRGPWQGHKDWERASAGASGLRRA